MSAPATGTTHLRGLYAARFGFAIVWAAALAATGSSLNAVSGTLLVAYPLFDLGAAVYDHRTSGGRAGGLLVTNMALSLLAAAGLAVATTSDIAAALRVWGAWAITAASQMRVPTGTGITA